MPCTTQSLPFAATGQFSPLALDYLSRAPHLAPFYHRWPEIGAFGEQLAEKGAAYSAGSRATLVAELRRQYAERLGEAPHPTLVANLDRLARPTTFTVTTGHQLNLLGGPLYFAYKIISTIKLAQQLKAAYPAHDFVPVFWMATEDHDVAEIDHFTLHGQPYRWETDQRGAMGRLRPDAALAALLAALPEHGPAVEAAYAAAATVPNFTLADATRRLVHTLFGAHGLVALDADSPALKAALRPVVASELHGPAVQKAVHTANEELAAWYKPQVYPRPINLFHLAADSPQRERFERHDDGTLAVLNTNLTFTPAEAAALADAYPEQFSPNVVLRPVYQELVLPNLAYIGGAAEVAYWLQLKGVFAHFGVPMPVVLLRDSAAYLARPVAVKAAKLQLAPEDLFADLPALKRRVAERLGDAPLTLADEQARVAAVFADIQAQATAIDPTLEKAVAAEAQRAATALDGLRKRLEKARDARHETAFAQLATIREKLLPGGVLQERVESLSTLLTSNPTVIDDLLAAFDPLAGQFTVLTETA